MGNKESHFLFRWDRKSTSGSQQTKISPGKQVSMMHKHASFSQICVHASHFHRTIKKNEYLAAGGGPKPSSWPAGSIFQIRSVSGDLSMSRHSQVSISLCLNRLSLTVLVLPVYLSRWPPLWRATGAECLGQPRGQALTRPASKLRQSLPRVELPQAALLSTTFVCSDKKAASWSKHTQTKGKEEQEDRKNGAGR